MTTFTEAQAQARLADVLRQARIDGVARIRAADGAEYVVTPLARSPLDTGHATLQQPITSEHIVAAVREGRAR